MSDGQYDDLVVWLSTPQGGFTTTPSEVEQIGPSSDTVSNGKNYRRVISPVTVTTT